MHGYVKNMVFDEIEIVVAGTSKANVAEFRKIINQYPQGSKVTNIEEENYDEPVMVGFEIEETFNVTSAKSVQHAMRKMEKDLNHMTKQKNRTEKDNRQILESTSWKVTEPLRKMGALVKKK